MLPYLQECIQVVQERRIYNDKLPSEATLFTDCLQKNGYYTMLVGKNHGTNSPEIEKRFDYLKSVGKPWKMGDLWVEALRQRPKDKPFFYVCRFS